LLLDLDAELGGARNQGGDIGGRHPGGGAYAGRPRLDDPAPRPVGLAPRPVG
jgi:hypothetical protein